MSRDVRALGAVPRWLWGLLAAALVAQITWRMASSTGDAWDFGAAGEPDGGVGRECDFQCDGGWTSAGDLPVEEGSFTADRADGQFADDQPGAAPVAVITDEYWQRKFGRDAQVIGRAILVERVPVTIVGISPPGFSARTSEKWRISRSRSPPTRNFSPK